jgi:hypothetical protein
VDILYETEKELLLVQELGQMMFPQGALHDEVEAYI